MTSILTLQAALARSERECARVEREARDQHARIAELTEALAAANAALAFKTEQLAMYMPPAKVAGNHPPPARRAQAKRKASVWTADRLVEVWAKHHENGYTPLSLARHYDEPRSAHTLKVFLDRMYNTAAALDAYKRLGVEPAWL